MKFGRIARQGLDGKAARLVVVEPEKNRVIDLVNAATLHYQSKKHATEEAALKLAQAAFPGSMAEALSTGDFLKEHAAAVVASHGDDAAIAIDAVEWLPASDPPALRDGLNFLGHIIGWSAKMGRTVPDAMERIVPYTHNATSMVIGHNATVQWPGYIKRMDYELELGWVIGRRGHNLTPETAMDCLFGVTLYNDFSGRDLQADELPIGMGATKSKNFGHAIGPWITTIDEFDDLTKIPMEVRLNGKTMGKGDSGGILWPLPDVLSFVSLGEWLRPGDVIGSGTMGGGSALELDVVLQPGDVVELEAGGVGVLRNVMGEPEQGLWWPTPQPGVLVKPA